MVRVLLARAVLGPVLLVQAARLRRRALRLPEPAGARAGSAFPAAGRASAASATALRLLVVGDSSAVGVGVRHQSEALAAPLAGCLSDALGVPVHWQLVGRSGVDAREALALLREQSCAPADLVVLVLGVNDVTGQRAPVRFAQDYRALLGYLALATGAHRWVLCGLPPMQRFPAVPQPLRWYVGQCARRLDTRLRALCAANPAWSFLSMASLPVEDAMAADGFHPGAVLYRRCARRIADHVVQQMSQPRTGPLEA